MGLRDQFDKLRNYFIEDDYDEDDEVFENHPAPRSSTVNSKKINTNIYSGPQRTPPQVPSQPVISQPSAQQRTAQQRTMQQVARPIGVGTGARPVQQHVPSPSNVHRSMGGNSGINPAYVSKANPQSTVLTRATVGAVSSSKISMVTPHAYSEITDMANTLRSGITIIVNFKNMGDQQARRSIDFLTGVVFVLEGEIESIGGSSYLVTPTGVDVERARESALSLGASQGFEGMDFMVN
ncbi:MAG: cell division protein SepF [Lactovum sp.]